MCLEPILVRIHSFLTQIDADFIDNLVTEAVTNQEDIFLTIILDKDDRY